MTEQKNAVQKMQDYIEKHLNEEIMLTNLSKVSLFSPWYSYRLFLKYTHITPSEYIRKLRLSKASEYLKKRKLSSDRYCF